MLTLLGLMQFVWIGLVHHTMQRAAEHGVRSYAIQGYTKAQSEQRGRDVLTEIFGSLANDFQITASNSSNDRTVVISIPTSTHWVSFGDVFSLLSSRPELRARATLRDEASY